VYCDKFVRPGTDAQYDEVFPILKQTPAKYINDSNEQRSQSRNLQYKLKPPQTYTMGQNFSTFRLIILNYLKQTDDLEQQKAILLSLIETNLFAIAHPVVEKGTSLPAILCELQTLFNPVDEIGTRLSKFQDTVQLPGQGVSQYALKITELGRLAHPCANEDHLQDILVNQFVAGLQDSSIKGTLRLLAPKTLHEAVALVKRTIGAEPMSESTAKIAALKVGPKTEPILRPNCPLCRQTTHSDAFQCPNFKVVPAGSNDNHRTNNNNDFQQRSNYQYQRNGNFQQRPYQEYYQRNSNFQNNGNRFNPNRGANNNRFGNNQEQNRFNRDLPFNSRGGGAERGDARPWRSNPKN
jgi:hypothetical protein